MKTEANIRRYLRHWREAEAMLCRNPLCIECQVSRQMCVSWINILLWTLGESAEGDAAEEKTMKAMSEYRERHGVSG